MEQKEKLLQDLKEEARVNDEKFERRLGNALLAREQAALAAHKKAEGGKARQKAMAELMDQREMLKGTQRKVRRRKDDAMCRLI